eukprot:SAG31_NODE_1596_length_7800_cov_4.335801_1_plen_182_part_00
MPNVARCLRHRGQAGLVNAIHTNTVTVRTLESSCCLDRHSCPGSQSNPISIEYINVEERGSRRKHLFLVRAASVITAFPMDEDNHQGWHRDTPEDDVMIGAWHQITIMVYMTNVSTSNGGTQFRRMASRDEVVIEGPPGTTVAFLSSACVHRGLTNRETKPRVLLYIAFDAEDNEAKKNEA